MSSPIAPVRAPQVPPSAETSATKSAAVADPRAEKVRRAAHDFESILVKQLLTAAHVGGDGKGGYGDMAVDALANGVEKGGGLGLADQIAKALSGAAAPIKPGR